MAAILSAVRFPVSRVSSLACGSVSVIAAGASRRVSQKSMWGVFMAGLRECRSALQSSGSMYPPEVDICNCGADLGRPIPKPELLACDDLEEGTLPWRIQMYGAALYWHVASVPGDQDDTVDLNMLRGKDVLEVGCMRGGGARYLASVAGTRSYVATDIEDEHVELCRRRWLPNEGGSHPGGLRFEVAAAAKLADVYPADCFDFVLCVQSIALFADPEGFVRGARHVLRPGGRLIICEALSRRHLQKLLGSVEEAGLVCDAVNDLSSAVNSVGFCSIVGERSYVHLVASKG